MSKIIITIVGKDRVGIVAKTCNYLADNQMNILDITQTILQDYFNMMMIVDISRAEKSFDDMARELSEVGNLYQHAPDLTGGRRRKDGTSND